MGVIWAAAALAAIALVPSGAEAASLPPLPPSPLTTSITQSLQNLTAFINGECGTLSLDRQPALGGVCEQAAELAGTDAYLYGIAPMEFLRQRRQQTSVTVPNSLSDAPVNQFGSARTLATASGNQVFVQPNNDTLYTMGHLDLKHTSLVLHVPNVPNGRYYVMQFLDPYTNVFAYVGTRTTGDGAGNFLIVGPSWHGSAPHGMPVIRSPYNLAWVAGRTLVNGLSDLKNVHRIQNGYRLIPLRQYRKHGLKWRPRRPRRIVSTHTKASEPSGIYFFDALGDALAKSPPPAADGRILSELRTIGIGPGLHPSQAHLSTPVLQGLAAAANNGPGYMYTARTLTAAQGALQHRGWFVPFADTGQFGTDYQWRAIVAVFGLAANRPEEAVYTIGVADQTSQLLDGTHSYMIHFPAGQLPPARYFWSLTMYDSSFYLVPNPINRYSLGDRSHGLVKNSDGSLDIYIQHNPPAGHESNWLPAPGHGTFEVTLRMYGPQANVVNDTYSYPAIARTG